jgi:hypothetical protein
MTPTRLVLIALTTLALLQTVYADNKKDGGATPTAKTPTSNPSGPVPIPYPNAPKSSIMKTKHDTSKNRTSNIK